MMEDLAKLLLTRGRAQAWELAEELGLSPEEVERQIASWEEDGTILGYQTVFDPERQQQKMVRAFIEVRLTPERGGGFDRLGRRIARFEQVQSAYLLSGGYDLMVVVEGQDLLEVARFVSEKLSTLEGVLSTATHFGLRSYKENGFFFGESEDPERLPVTP